MSSPRLIKSYNLIEKLISPSPLGRLKTKSTTYQIDSDSTLAEEIKKAILSACPGIKEQHISGKLIVHLHLGGVMALEFTEVERIKESLAI